MAEKDKAKELGFAEKLKQRMAQGFADPMDRKADRLAAAMTTKQDPVGGRVYTKEQPEQSGGMFDSVKKALIAAGSSDVAKRAAPIVAGTIFGPGTVAGAQLASKFIGNLMPENKPATPEAAATPVMPSPAPVDKNESGPWGKIKEQLQEMQEKQMFSPKPVAPVEQPSPQSPMKKSVPSPVVQDEIKQVAPSIMKEEPIPQLQAPYEAKSMDLEKVKKDAIIQKAQEITPESTPDHLAAALLTLIPTAIGGLAGGLKGAAIGSRVGAEGTKDYYEAIAKKEAEAKKQKFEIGKEERAFAREASLKKADQEFQIAKDKQGQEAKIREKKIDDAYKRNQMKFEKQLKDIASPLDKAKFDQSVLEANRKYKEDLRHNRETEDTARLNALSTWMKNNKEAQGAAFKPEMDMRKEYQNLKTTKDTHDVVSSYNKILGASPTAAGDLSLIFAYMKMLDPGSVVREGEQASAANARGVPEAIRTMYNRVISGERLGKNQREDFKNQAVGLYKSQMKSQKRFDDQYKELAKRYDLDPSNIVVDWNDPVAVERIGSALSTSGKQDDVLGSMTDEQLKLMHKALGD